MEQFYPRNFPYNYGGYSNVSGPYGMTGYMPFGSPQFNNNSMNYHDSYNHRTGINGAMFPQSPNFPNHRQSLGGNSQTSNITHDVTTTPVQSDQTNGLPHNVISTPVTSDTEMSRDDLIDILEKYSINSTETVHISVSLVQRLLVTLRECVCNGKTDDIYSHTEFNTPKSVASHRLSVSI